MSYIFRKIFVAAVLTLSSTGFAQTECYVESVPESCYMDCIPACYFEKCDQWFVEADLICFRPFQGGFSSVCDSTHISDSIEDGIVVSRLCGKGREPNFKWDLGFRVGVGYEFADNYTDIEAYYTRFNSQTGKQHGRNQQHWQLDYDVLDLLYRVKCDWACRLNIYPFAGIKYANINQKIRTKFTNIIDGSHFSSRGRSREEFSGTGPQFGVEGDIDIGCGFSLYGNISAAVLYGNFHVKSRNKENFDTGINIDRTTSHFRACQSVVDASFGARYNFFISCERYISLQAAFEQHRYFNHNQICDYGDFSLDGVSIGLSTVY